MFGSPVTSPCFALALIHVSVCLRPLSSLSDTEILPSWLLAHMSGLRHIALMRNRVCQTLWPLDWAALLQAYGLEVDVG